MRVEFLSVAIFLTLLSGCGGSAPTDDVVFSQFVESKKRFSRGVNYQFLTNECQEKTRKVKDEFNPQEDTYWLCKLTEKHNTVYGMVTHEHAIEMQFAENQWVLLSSLDYDVYMARKNKNG